MGEMKILAQRFKTNRNHLQAVVHRMLGSHSDAEDWDAPSPYDLAAGRPQT
jgi:DNA-directed RNA polymerase specialized sigma24 family protein